MWVAVAGSGTVIVASRMRGGGRAIRLAMVVTAVAAASATLVLVVALVNRDYSLAYVADTTSSDTPVMYRIAALWGGARGSLMLFAAMLAVAAATGSRQLSGSALLKPATTIMAAVVGITLLGLVLVGSPFARLAVPAVDGRGMVAILRHPAMLVHPLILYLGHTMLIVPFAVAVAGLLIGNQDDNWIPIVDRWLVGAWTALTLGMVGGSMWAYVELGWGGFWAWDSVENSALLPWLAITAYLHVPAVRRSARGSPSVVALAMLPFVLTTLGVYVTRSGLTGSVHAFAGASSVARFSLGLCLLVLVTAAVVTVLGVRRGNGRSRHGEGRWHVFALVVLGWSLAVVAIGTVYPLLVRTEGAGVTVAPRWFVMMLVPGAVAAFGGLVAAADALGSLQTRVAGFIVVTTVAVGVGSGAGSLPLLPMFVAASAAATSLITLGSLVRTRGAAAIAHLGFALLLLGAAGSAFGAEYHGGVSTGDVVVVGGHELAVGQIDVGSRSDHAYIAVLLTAGGESGSVVTPEWRAYDGSIRPTSEPAFRAGLINDYVIAISRVSDDASVVWLDVFVRPMMIWVWAGGLLMAISGLLGLGGTAGFSAGRHRWATTTPRRG